MCWLWSEGEEPRGEIDGWWLPAGGWWAGDTCSSEGLGVPLLLGSWSQRFVAGPAKGQTWFELRHLAQVPGMASSEKNGRQYEKLPKNFHTFPVGFAGHSEHYAYGRGYAVPRH